MKAILFLVDPDFREDPLTGNLNLFQTPLYDQPMLFYCLSNLMEWFFRQIMLVGDGHTLTGLQKLLGDGSQFGIQLEYQRSPKPANLLTVLAKLGDYVRDTPVCLMLGHNFFWGENLQGFFTAAPAGARIFCSQGQSCEQYGVLRFQDEKGQETSWRVPDLGFYDPSVISLAKRLHSTGNPSQDLELLNRHYAALERLEILRWGRDMRWFDVRDLATLWRAARQVEEIELMTEQKVCCLEELAVHTGLVDAAQCGALCERHPPGPYREYLKKMCIRSGLLPEEPRGLRLASRE
jgi:glucose-1-phosphate thymidylyltransferase